MTIPNRPDLLGYLVDALEIDERAAVELALRQDPSLKDELRRVRRQLEILRSPDVEWNGFETADDERAGCESAFGEYPCSDEADWNCPPPSGLVDRTLQFIADQTSIDGRSSDSDAGPRSSMGEPSELVPSAAITGSPFPSDHDGQTYIEPAGKRSWRGAARESLAPPSQRWRLADVAVALAVCIAGAGLIFPLISASRSNAQIMACANNLREIGTALTEYSEHQNGFFPRVAETGALAAGGIYAPTLLSGGYVANPRLFVCPASSLADDSSLRIPTMADIQRATGDELVQLRRQMGGSYGYALGYRQAGVYKPTRNLYRDSFALVADMPSEDCTGSPNHAGNGHNVLLEDGHIVFLKSCRLEGSTDDIFTNDEGKAAAGCHVNDAVVVRSDVSP